MVEIENHSPGPWRAAIDDVFPRQNEDRIEIACLPHNMCDAIDVFGPNLGRELTPSELRANARLLAASPELLEAAKAAMSILPKYQMKGDTVGDDEALDAVFERLGEAIYKAEVGV